MRIVNVFLSYSHHDKPYARDIAERLEKKGLTCFFAEKIDAGKPFADEIRNNLRLCNEVFILISANAIRSKWIFAEYGAGWALHKHISPILLGVSPGLLPDILKPWQTKDYLQIEEVIEACKKRISTEPDLEGEWKYNFYGSNGLLIYAGSCKIQHGEDGLRFIGTRTLEIRDNGQRQEVNIPWSSSWAAIFPDGKVRAEYKLGNVHNGYLSLMIPPDRPVQKISGEVFLLLTNEFGGIEFIRI